MGQIHIEMFATLDLVGQGPGGPDEDPIGFAFGGWQAPLLDEITGAQVGAAYEGTDALLQMPDGDELILNPVFERHMRRLENWTLGDAFHDAFPQLKGTYNWKRDPKHHENLRRTSGDGRP